MGVDTKGIINRKLDVEEVYNYIVGKIDNNAKLFKDDGKNHTPVHNIQFEDGTDIRTLSVICSSDKEYNEYSDFYFSDDEKNYVWLLLGCFGNSKGIMESIVNQFGGYIDEDDCDDEGFYFIPANPDATVPPVIRVTLKDIYDKFGGIVVIIK